MLKEMFGRMRRDGEPRMPAVDYDEQKRMVGDADPKVRCRLAGRQDARPEILYYLARDPSPDVRRAVAANDATPAQADLLLARDEAEEVRGELARKIARLLPDIPATERARVREMTIETLDTLAQDQLPRVRAILAQELKHSELAPRDVVLRRARDLHQIVHAAILEYSPLLSDADLTEVIAAGTARQALQAIARRRDLSADVSQAVAATLDVPAVATLLANRSAQVRSETLDMLAENAEAIEDWHEPMVMRAELSVRAVRRISGFVAAALVEVLAKRNDLDEITAAELQTRVQDRLRRSEGEEEDQVRAEVRLMHKDGTLDEETIIAALDDGRRGFVTQALALKAAITVEAVERIVRTHNARALTALAWQARLSMRAALQLQSKLGRVPPRQMLHARNGTDFPMTPDEMTWQLQTFA